MHGAVPALLFVGLTFAATVALAAFSYHFFERYFLKMKPKAKLKLASKDASGSLARAA